MKKLAALLLLSLLSIQSLATVEVDDTSEASLNAEALLHDSVDAYIEKFIDLKDDGTIDNVGFSRGYESSLVLDRRLSGFAASACELSDKNNLDKCKNEVILKVVDGLEQALKAEKFEDVILPSPLGFKSISEVCASVTDSFQLLTCLHNELSLREEKLMTDAAKVSTPTIFLAGQGLTVGEAYAEVITTLFGKTGLDKKISSLIVKDAMVAFVRQSMGLRQQTKPGLILE
ncbi:hypothetical protein [Bdellovibrio reynosensis]|uniref:Uncharacterized protein n=1 Tax=Bdellovibrio reynosensis TaxID=2835041 RepID=A0ABY4C940_9BACT|nr:hypothetical protein [Bdellovibrio reynosensis]UOF01507.1 hypothetical protein MNR06_00885 [Bdellovibrio reynosensis]